MNAAKMIAMMGRGARRFVGAAGGLQVSTGNVPIPYPAGSRVGDLAFVFLNNNGSPGTLSTPGWSSVTPPGVGGDIFWKRLVLADLTATATITLLGGNSLYTMVFRGYAASTNRTNQGLAINNGTTSRTWTGFTKGAGCKAILIFMAGNVSTPMLVTAPVMANATYDPAAGNSTGQYKVRILYNLEPSQYVDGTGIAETYGSGWNQVALAAFALT